MPAVILDACGILNLYASGRFEGILTTLSYEWYVPLAVEQETHWYRQPDPSDPGKLLKVPIDLAPYFEAGIASRCWCESDLETTLFVEIAAEIGDDGESMGLAIAKQRGWSVLTDDKKARRIAAELGIEVLATTRVIRQWAESINLQGSELATVLRAIERFGNFQPRRSDEHFLWWSEVIQQHDA